MIQIKLRPATLLELGAVIELYDTVAQWLTAKGLRQWEYPTPPQVVQAARNGIDGGNVMIGFIPGDKKPAATLRLAWEGAPLWPNEANAGYVFAMALRPELIGKGYGSKLLKWAEGEMKKREKTIFRLDCLSSNKFLHGYYRKHGFTQVGEAKDGEYLLSLYEKKI